MATLTGSLFCFSETLLNLWKQNTKQMKSTQLRIGNWYNEFGIPKQATPEIISNLYAIEQNGKIAIDFDFLPLTEEWLLKAGFELYDYEPNEEGDEFPDFIYMSYKITPPEKLYYYTITNTPEDGGYFDFCIKVQFADYVMLSTLQYVHQLQNLYFALTGKELEFKL